MIDDADGAAIIAALGLTPHPEGGWYRETFRAEPAGGRSGGRSALTAIHFLLEAGQRSHWHRVDAVEIWCWHAGAALRLETAGSDAGPVVEARLGPDFIDGDCLQFVVPAGHWQAACGEDGWVLVSCIVAPGFEFSGFELAPPGWRPGQH